MRWLATLLIAAFGAISAPAYTLDSGSKTATTDGSSSDLQAAHDDVAVLDNGTWTLTSPGGGSDSFSVTLTVTKAVHIRSTSGYATITGSSGPLIDVTKSPNGIIRFSGFKFSGAAGSTSGGTAKFVVGGDWGDYPVILSDSYFEENGTRAIRWEVNGGIISNVRFMATGSEETSTAIQHKDDSDLEGTWNTASTLGAVDSTGKKNLYIEDCKFTNFWYQSMDFDGAARTVVRYNFFEETATTSHGADTGPVGMRQVDLYKNQFQTTDFGDCDGSATVPIAYWVFIRGGTGNCYSNTFSKLDSCAWGTPPEIKFQIQNIRRSGAISCQTSYPAFHQVGTGHNGTSQILDPFYCWNNTVTEGTIKIGSDQYEPDTCGNGQLQDNYLVENVDYFKNTARPGYSGYTYPHPLLGDSGGGSGNGVTVSTVPGATMRKGKR